MSKPIDFADMLTHIAAARGCPEPNQAQIAEMERALRTIRPDAVRTAVAEWLRTDTTAIKRLPYPGEILPGAQRHARLAALAERNTTTGDDLVTCWHCDGTGFTFDDDGTAVKPCQRCLPATYSRWKRGHYHPKHNEASCAECTAMRSNNRPVASAIAAEVDPDPTTSIWNRTRQEPA